MVFSSIKFSKPKVQAVCLTFKPPYANNVSITPSQYANIVSVLTTRVQFSLLINRMQLTACLLTTDVGFRVL